MNTALAWFGKEWRYQWRSLAAFVLLAVPSLTLVCWLMPDWRWRDTSAGSEVLSWYFGLGVVGAVVFAAPQLVRGEFAPQHDHFVRRLPGGLRAAAAGKLLFLLLVSLLLPLLALLLGELALRALGHDWTDLFQPWGTDHAIVTLWPGTGLVAAASPLVAPWVAAIATWMPRGRMAVGATALLALLCAFPAYLLLRDCPGLEQTIEWRPWLFAAGPLGAVLCVVSWLGRRGGGSLRSAKCGGVAFATLVALVGGWFGSEVWRYRAPDPERLVDLDVHGTSPDGRFALISGAADERWSGQPAFRLDLETGRAEQIAGWGEMITPAPQDQWSTGQRGLRARTWWLFYGDERARIYDLTTDAWHKARVTAAGLDIAADVRTGIEGDLRAAAPFALAGGRRAWRADDRLCIERPDGSVKSRPWPAEFARVFVVDHGHGFGPIMSQGAVMYDLTREHVVRMPDDARWAMAVQGEWLVLAGRRQLVTATTPARVVWSRFDPDTATTEPRPELDDAFCRGLLDDERMLFERGPGVGVPAEYFAYRPVDRRIESVALPRGELGPDFAFVPAGRDARGRRWLSVRQRVDSTYLALDPTALRVELLPIEPGKLFRRDGTAAYTVEGGRRIVRTDWTTGARTVIYPPAER